MDEECKRFERRRPSTSVKFIIHKSPAKPAVCQSRWSWWSKKSKLAQNTKTKQINREKVRKRTTNIFYLPKSFAENLFIYLKNTNKPSTFTQVLIWYWYRWYWPCIYLLSDQYQIFQLSKLYLSRMWAAWWGGRFTQKLSLNHNILRFNQIDAFKSLEKVTEKVNTLFSFCRLFWESILRTCWRSVRQVSAPRGSWVRRLSRRFACSPWVNGGVPYKSLQRYSTRSASAVGGLGCASGTSHLSWVRSGRRQPS